MSDWQDLNARLSEAGRERSEQILSDLRGRLRKSVRRRRAVRRAGVGMAAAAAVGLTAWVSWPRGVASPKIEVTEREPAPVDEAPAVTPIIAVESSAPKRVLYTIVSTASQPLAACGEREAGQPATSACLMNDRQLINALSETGGEFGVVRVGGRTIVVRADGSQLGEGG